MALVSLYIRDNRQSKFGCHAPYKSKYDDTVLIYEASNNIRTVSYYGATIMH